MTALTPKQVSHGDKGQALRFANLDTAPADARLCNRPILSARASALDSATDEVKGWAEQFSGVRSLPGVGRGVMGSPVVASVRRAGKGSPLFLPDFAW
jgi:hypothetical protein